MDNIIEFTIKVVAKDIELDYILAGAFEGGSNYWIKKIVIEEDDYKGTDFASDAVSKGATLEIHIDEPIDASDHIIYKLDKQRLINGIQLYANIFNKLEFDNMDAGDYDNILQLALFKEIIFG